jgi:hypothetical protein
MRHYLRQEPYAANPLVRIREGGNLQRLSLPRQYEWASIQWYGECVGLLKSWFNWLAEG